MKKTLTCLAVLLMAVAAMAFNTITFVFKDGTLKSYIDSDIDSIGMGAPSTPAKDSFYVYLKNKTKEAANINDVDSIRFNLIEEDSCLTVSAEESDLEFTYNDDSMTAEVAGPKNRDIKTDTIPCKIEKDGKIYEVTSIGDFAFARYSSLTSIKIPESVTSIGNSTFKDCTSLTSITVSDENKNYTSVDGVLYNKDITKLIACPSGLKSIEIPESVTSMEMYAFSGYNLTSIEIPESVTSIGGYTFYECRRLTSIEIPNAVTSIGYAAFYGCSSLTSIEIPESVTDIGSYAFAGCSSLPPHLLVYNKGTKCYGWVGDKSNCIDVTIPESVTSIEDGAFGSCSKLTSIVIPNSVTSIGISVFYGCDSLKTAKVPEGLDISDAKFPSTTEIIRY